jgi:hypothetical protein
VQLLGVLRRKSWTRWQITVSIIPSVLHTHTLIYHRRWTELKSSLNNKLKNKRKNNTEIKKSDFNTVGLFKIFKTQTILLLALQRSRILNAPRCFYLGVLKTLCECAVQLLIYRQLQMSEIRVRRFGGKMVTWEDRRFRWKTCPSSTMSITSHLDCRGSNPGLWVERPVITAWAMARPISISRLC